MNLIRKEKSQELIKSNQENGLKITFSGKKVSIQKQRSLWEFIYWVALVFGILIYCIMNGYSSNKLLIIISLSLALVYLIYDSLLTSNSLIFDLDRRVLSISSSKWINKTERKLMFDEIKNISLEQKSFGRGQRVGRRLHIEIIDGQILSAVDFRNVSLAETVEKFIIAILSTKRTT